MLLRSFVHKRVGEFSYVVSVTYSIMNFIVKCHQHLHKLNNVSFNLRAFFRGKLHFISMTMLFLESRLQTLLAMWQKPQTSTEEFLWRYLLAQSSRNIWNASHAEATLKCTQINPLKGFVAALFNLHSNNRVVVFLRNFFLLSKKEIYVSI